MHYPRVYRPVSCLHKCVGAVLFLILAVIGISVSWVISVYFVGLTWIIGVIGLLLAGLALWLATRPLPRE